MGKNSKNQPGVKEVAEAAGVSSATISRVFNQHAYVSDEVRDRVLKVAREMGYAPTISSSRNLFGILAYDEETFFQSYSHQVMMAVAREFFAHGCNVQIFSRSQFPYILRNTFRGVLVFSAGDAEFFRKAQIPCVVINDLKEGLWNIITDHAESVRLAVEYLLRRNHRRIAYLGAGYEAWGANERWRGYREAMQVAGIPESEWLMGTFHKTERDIPVAIARLHAAGMTALIVEGEGNGLIVDHALKTLKIKVPEELSLITFEGADYSRFLFPEHTTVSQDFRNLGRAAAETLLDLTIRSRHRKTLPTTQIFHNHLIERDSCRSLS